MPENLTKEEWFARSIEWFGGDPIVKADDGRYHVLLRMDPPTQLVIDPEKRSVAWMEYCEDQWVGFGVVEGHRKLRDG